MAALEAKNRFGELLDAARADLESIARFTLERWGWEQALVYLDALEGRLTELAQRPALGRRREELADGLLSFPFESHVIFYRKIRGGIVVARIPHARRDADRHLR